MNCHKCKKAFTNNETIKYINDNVYCEFCYHNIDLCYNCMVVVHKDDMFEICTERRDEIDMLCGKCYIEALGDNRKSILSNLLIKKWLPQAIN